MLCFLLYQNQEKNKNQEIFLKIRYTCLYKYEQSHQANFYTKITASNSVGECEYAHLQERRRAAVINREEKGGERTG
jgi:hypothetical protein